MEYYAKAQFDKLSPSCTQQASKQLPSHLACPNEYCPLRCTLQSEITFLAPKKYSVPCTKSTNNQINPFELPYNFKETLLDGWRCVWHYEHRRRRRRPDNSRGTHIKSVETRLTTPFTCYLFYGCATHLCVYSKLMTTPAHNDDAT